MDGIDAPRGRAHGYDCAMQDFNRLRVAEQAMVLAVAVYRLTSRFPPDERFGLAAQMRRAAVSIGSNIAEGCGRRRNGELLQFLYIASGSARELAFQMRLAHDLGYGEGEEQERTRDEIDHVQRMLNRLTAHLSRHAQTKRGEERSKRTSPR
jgi:four helix bundle protein